MFGDFAQRGFEGLGVTLRVEDLLAKGDKLTAWRLLDFGEFGINDGDRFSFGRDLGILGLELGQEDFQVGDCLLHFGVGGIAVLDADDGPRIVLNDLARLGVDGVFRGFRHRFYWGLSSFCVGLEFFDHGADFLWVYVVLV